MGCSLTSQKNAIGLRGTNDQFQLGCLSIDRVLYFNQEPATFTGSFILNELKRSMDWGTPITLVPEVPDFVRPDKPSSLLEVVQVDVTDGSLDLGKD